MTTFAARLTGAAMLDVRIYEEVEADRAAMGQAILRGGAFEPRRRRWRPPSPCADGACWPAS